MESRLLRADTGRIVIRVGRRPVLIVADPSGRGRITRNGRDVTSRFAHFFTLRDGRIVRLQQTSDTLPIARALEE
ncbi:hypothetical protein GCM10010211_74990 [Streptomyces albospinus]|uniref:Uncharacterized protein n=1 Tax=Streptomyces albospinus TaxID=285515 RepID=A0ABQ2VMH0_9ACTN|nr:hypothetical protein [Streptomyces albospinus]GGU96674.1 hypothetical protein GCM10010211_74990 [Streptomyces albospinus]